MQTVSLKAKNGASDCAADYLRNGIITGVWSPGERIPSEHQLCKTLNVSRVSVRAAINQLAGQGILASKQGSGTFVCQPNSNIPFNAMLSSFVLSTSDRLSMLEFRKTIEVAAAGFAAARATTELVDKMSVATDAMARATEFSDIVNYDLEFHYLITKATGNFAFIKSFEALQSTYISMLEENVAILGNFGADFHRKILSAIEIRNSELAKEYMLEHFDQTAMRTVLSKT